MSFSTIERFVHPETSARSRGGALRYGLGGLLLFAALNAFAGGYYALAGAKDIPRDWLVDSPFRDYFVPGLILFGVVGGSLLAAAVAVLGRKPFAALAAYAAGVVLLAWLGVEMIIIGYVSWMQPATAAAGLLILLAAWGLPGARAATESA
jgi:hypothetical protein